MPTRIWSFGEQHGYPEGSKGTASEFDHGYVDIQMYDMKLLQLHDSSNNPLRSGSRLTLPLDCHWVQKRIAEGPGRTYPLFYGVQSALNPVLHERCRGATDRLSCIQRVWVSVELTSEARFFVPNAASKNNSHINRRHDKCRCIQQNTARHSFRSAHYSQPS